MRGVAVVLFAVAFSVVSAQWQENSGGYGEYAEGYDMDEDSNVNGDFDDYVAYVEEAAAGGVAPQTGDFRQLGKKHKGNQVVNVQPMEFHNMPFSEPSVGGYRPPAQAYGPSAGSVGVAPWTSVIETDHRLRLTQVMGEEGVETEVFYPDGANSRMLGKKHKGNQVVNVQPMEFHNMPFSEPSVGGYRPPAQAYGPSAGSVGVAPWTSVIDTDHRLRLTQVMGDDGVQTEVFFPEGANSRMLAKENKGQTNVGGSVVLNGQPAGVVNVEQWTSMVETDDHLRLTEVMSAEELATPDEIFASAGPRMMSRTAPEIRDVPYYKWETVVPATAADTKAANSEGGAARDMGGM